MSAPSYPESPIAMVPGDGYRAGACNIGPWEIRRRRASAVLALGAAVALLVLLVSMDAPAWTRLLVLLPAWGGAVSWLQARRRFCVAFGMAGIANFADDDRGRIQIDAAAQREADRRAAAAILRDGFLLAIVPVLIVVLLPL
jgi:preprotein translocase subunit Sec61beta